MSEIKFPLKFCSETNCQECKFSDFGQSTNCNFDCSSYQQGRADAFKQILEQMKSYRDAHYYSFANYDVQKYADGFKNATDTLISMVEQQIKEQKNE